MMDNKEIDNLEVGDVVFYGKNNVPRRIKKIGYRRGQKSWFFLPRMRGGGLSFRALHVIIERAQLRTTCSLMPKKKVDKKPMFVRCYQRVYSAIEIPFLAYVIDDGHNRFYTISLTSDGKDPQKVLRGSCSEPFYDKKEARITEYRKAKRDGKGSETL